MRDSEYQRCNHCLMCQWVLMKFKIYKRNYFLAIGQHHGYENLEYTSHRKMQPRNGSVA